MRVPAPLPAYRNRPAYGVEEGRSVFRRLDFNEGPPPDLGTLSRALALCAHGATVYPEYGSLKRAAAQAWKVDPAMLMPVNGADEGIALVLRAFTGPHAPLVLPVPSFPMYRIYADLGGSPVVAVPLAPDFAVEVEATVAALPGGALLALTSPNNPTGRALPEADLRRLLGTAEGRPVILDETYAPFAGQDFSPLLVEFPNLILLRTLSKAYGLPGLRCGLILADARLIRSLEPLRSPFNVNGVAALLGAQILAGDAGWRARLQGAVAARRRLQARLDSEGIPTVPSDAHFFLAWLGPRAAAAVARLRSLGILVKDLQATLPGFLRISVTGDPDTEAFLEAFLPWWDLETTGARS